MAKQALVAIHQPTFFPWLGYFDKIVRSDFFVFLNNVQYPKKGGSWSNRVKIMISGVPDWITMPVIRNYSGTRNINQIEIDNSKIWNEKLIRTIEFNYRKTPYFFEIFPFITKLLELRSRNISEYNISVIHSICDYLEIATTHFVLASTLKTSGNATDLLISIIKELDADSYMCGGGAFKYQEDGKFEANGIKLLYQNFVHPVYAQYNIKEFVPGLSVIDLLMNCGKEAASDIIKRCANTQILQQK